MDKMTDQGLRFSVKPSSPEPPKVEYKLLCAKTVTGLNDKVTEHIQKGFLPMGSHTHQKANHEDILQTQTWEHLFCISVLKN